MNTKKLPKTIIVFLLFFFASLWQLLILKEGNIDINSISATENIILTTFSETITLIILILIYFKDLKEDFKNIKKDFNKNIDIAFKSWLLGIIVMIVANLIINIFIRNATAGNEEAVQDLVKGSACLSIITLGFIGPVVEELVFRKSFKDIFKNKILFILASGLIFGGLHVILSLKSAWDLFYLISYSSLGIAFAYTYQKTENIFYSIFMHMFHNTFFTILSIYGIGAIIW